MTDIKVKNLVKPLLRFWHPWLYVPQYGYELTSDTKKAGIFTGNALYKVQDEFFFWRTKYEEVAE